MPISELQRTVAVRIKDWYRRHGMTTKQVSVHSSSGRGQWTQFRIRPDKSTDWRTPLTYPVSIPLEERIRALKIIYPNRPECWSGSAGNVDEHSISMSASEWDKFLNEALPV